MTDLDAFLPKARDLFRERRISWLLQLAGQDGHPSAEAHLLDLQCRIYALDDVLEHCWEPDPKALDLLWRSIREAPALHGIPETERNDLLGGLAEYQRQELSVRRGERLCDIPITAFYYRKTCDVRLARDLLYRSVPELETRMPRAAWEPLDRLTEVEDDLTDCEEDRLTFNGNRFLSAMQHRTLEELIEEYQAYAKSLAYAAHLQEPLGTWLEEALSRVLTLLGAATR